MGEKSKSNQCTDNRTDLFSFAPQTKPPSSQSFSRNVPVSINLLNVTNSLLVTMPYGRPLTLIALSDRHQYVRHSPAHFSRKSVLFRRPPLTLRFLRKISFHSSPPPATGLSVTVNCPPFALRLDVVDFATSSMPSVPTQMLVKRNASVLTIPSHIPPDSPLPLPPPPTHPNPRHIIIVYCISPQHWKSTNAVVTTKLLLGKRPLLVVFFFDRIAASACRL